MPVWQKVDCLFLKEYDIEAPEDFSNKVKKMSILEGAQYFIERFRLNHLTTDFVIDRIEQLVSEQYANQIPLKPYAEELLTYLKNKNIKLCIATATYPSLAMSALKRLDIYKYFEFILTCSEIGEGKNSPRIFTESAKRLGIDKNEIIIVEDSLHSIITAKSAGFYVAGVYDESSSDDWNMIKSSADICFSDLNELKLLF